MSPDSSSGVLRVALAQLNFLVGDVDGNTDRIVATLRELKAAGQVDLVVFPELAMCGYPPEDLLFHRGLRQRVSEGLERIRAETRGIAAVVGYPEFDGNRIYNAAAFIEDGAIRANYRKRVLPNYSVFDEARYFTAGDGPVIVTFRGVRLGLCICEDVWVPGPCQTLRDGGAELAIVINGSPFEIGKQRRREERVLGERARESRLPMVYLNLVGAQDELVFDGGSCVLDRTGTVRFRAPFFEEGVHRIRLDVRAGDLACDPASRAKVPEEIESVYSALVLGVRDYVRKNHFPGVVLGLSGGIDSALTLAIAVDALGAESVQAVQMPFRYTSAASLEDAEAQARAQGVDYHVLPIGDMVEAAKRTLVPVFDTAGGTTEENLQSRSRGVLLMAISNQTGRMVLATGNKSEMAVGYATLYGDMAGGFAPIKDCTKSLVYALSRFRNSVGAVIPERVITRPPSAELRPDQLDTDSLPPYEVLDPILDALILENRSVDDIAAMGFDRLTVARVLEMVRRAEYKRRQAPPGVRISGRAFGRDWRYPITSGYRHRP